MIVPETPTTQMEDLIMPKEAAIQIRIYISFLAIEAFFTKPDGLLLVCYLRLNTFNHYITHAHMHPLQAS